jgi:hypothetical protein
MADRTVDRLHRWPTRREVRPERRLGAREFAGYGGGSPPLAQMPRRIETAQFKVDTACRRGGRV